MPKKKPIETEDDLAEIRAFRARLAELRARKAQLYRAPKRNAAPKSIASIGGLATSSEEGRLWRQRKAAGKRGAK